MSRTIKGQKGPGYDYWGRRPYSGSCGYGPYIKLRTHRKERRRSKKLAYDFSQGDCHDS